MTAYSCLLCGGPVKVHRLQGEAVVSELCPPCNAGFIAAAELVAARMVTVVDGPTGAALEVLAGQLELDDEA